MGDVHLARPFNPRRGVPTPIVIKRLHGELTADENFIRRFRHEADIAVNVDSPHVAKVYDVGKVGDAFYIAMEYVPGWPLSKFLDAVLQSKRHASVTSVIDLIDGGLRGLHALHSAVDAKTGRHLGIVHRDISPKNLMVGEDGLMRLIDLGLGKSNVQDWKTRTGVVMGSVGYMPPEQVTADRVDHRADIYAMGVVLWETLALRNFLKRGTVPAMLHASLNPEWTPPSKFRPDLPTALDEVIHKAVRLEAVERYGSSAEFLAAIREVVPEKRGSAANSVGSLIKELFGAELEDRRLELEALLAMPLPYPDDEGPEPDKTVIFAEAKGVAPLTEEDLSPTSVQYSPSILPHTGGPAVNPMGVMPFAGPNAPMSMVSSINSNVIAPRQGIGLGTLFVAIVGTVMLTVAAMRFVAPPAPLVTSVDIADPGASEGIRATPSNNTPSNPPQGNPGTVRTPAVGSPVGSPNPVTNAVTSSPTTSPHDPPREKAKPRDKDPERPLEALRERPRPEERPIEASAESVKAAFDGIVRDGNAALAKLPTGDPNRDKIVQVLTEASMESGSTNYEAAGAKMVQLRSRLKALAP